MKKMKFFSFPMIILGLVLMLFSNCSKDPEVIVPTLTTTAVTEITDTGANSGGTITDEGGGTITASGVCWSKTADPRVEDSKTTDVATSGTFTSTITELEPNTTYHVRAYATNSAGTGYGNDIEFNSLVAPYRDQDGNIFETVMVGTKLWSSQNLNVKHFRNGDPIPVYKDNLTLLDGTAATIPWASEVEPYGAAAMLEPTMGSYVWSPDYEAKFGGQYNWWAANDPRDLAPAGWHVATIQDWKDLMTHIGYVPGGPDAANAAAISKLRSTDLWVDGGGTNTTGLSFPPSTQSAYDPSADYFGYPYEGNPVPENVYFAMWLKHNGDNAFYKDMAFIIHSTAWSLLDFNETQPQYGRESWGSTRIYRSGSVRIVKD